jgi:hypothetical protein
MARKIEVDEGELKHGLLGLVLALVEIIVEALRTQAVARVEEGTLTEKEVERLGLALMDLDEAITRIKAEQEIEEAVASVRSGLDDAVDELLSSFLLTEGEDSCRKETGRSWGGTA